MTPEEKAYIAGIIDGEGSIMLLKFHKNQLPAPCVSVANYIRAFRIYKRKNRNWNYKN